MIKWVYYNHAIIPVISPHKEIILGKEEINRLWKKKWKGLALFIKWTSNYNCKDKTQWWYCIKEGCFNIDNIKAKRRYEIKKGIKNFNVLLINPKEYLDEILKIQIGSYETYPAKYRPRLKNEKNKILEEIEEDAKKVDVFGAFDNTTNLLCGYVVIKHIDNFLALSKLKVLPMYEKKAINAALIYTVLENYKDELKRGIYISDGERNIRHETKFQDYLEKYFEFKKVYCQLNIEYRKEIRILIKLLFPFRYFLKKLPSNKFVHNLNSILLLEEIRRKF